MSEEIVPMRREFEAMPEGFWALPREDAISSDALNLIYAELCARVRQDLERVGGSSVDAMLAERTVFLYTWIRDTETRMTQTTTYTDAQGKVHPVTVRNNPFEGQRNYKEINQLWLAMVTQLQKTITGKDVLVASMEARDMVMTAVREVAVEVLGKTQAEDVLTRLMLRLVEAET